MENKLLVHCAARHLSPAVYRGAMSGGGAMEGKYVDVEGRDTECDEGMSGAVRRRSGSAFVRSDMY